MAEKIIQLPGSSMRLALKMLNIVLAVVISLFCFITGQNSKNQSGKPVSLSRLAGTLVKGTAGEPEYGTLPLYGIVEPPVAKYGIPFAEFIFTGNVKTTGDKRPIKNIKITLQDTAQKATLDSAYSDEEGKFELNYSGNALRNTWLLKAEDTNNNSGNFKDKDTLITFPLDSLRNGGILGGKGSMTVDLLLEERSSLVHPKGNQLSMEVLQTSPRLENASVLFRYRLPTPESVQLAAFNARGRRIATIESAQRREGEHTVLWNPGRLDKGVYYFRLVAGEYVLIIKGTF